MHSTRVLATVPYGPYRRRCAKISLSPRNIVTLHLPAVIHSSHKFSLSNSHMVNDSRVSRRIQTQNGKSLTRFDQRRYYIVPEVDFTFDSVHDDHPLSKHISTSLKRDKKDKTDHSNFHVSFLGTGGNTPSQSRHCSSTLLSIARETLIFDACEGVQRQLMFTRWPPKDIRKIFITHMHADHVFGLPGLILYLNQVAFNQQKDGIQAKLIVDIYGPPGLYNYISAVMTLSFSQLGYAIIVVHELMGSIADPGPSAKKREGRYERITGFEKANLHYNRLNMNNDGTWTLCVPLADSPDLARQNVYITAAEVSHVRGVATFGYVVKEVEPRRTIDVEKAKACGVMPGRKYRDLKAGISVESDDGTRMVHPDEIFADQIKHKARKFALLGDTWKLHPPMYALCQDCDVLVHEATLSDTLEDKPRIRGHSTPEMAGTVAANVNAAVLVLNHIGCKVSDQEGLSNIVAEAERANNGVSSIIVAHDFMEIKVPFLGFDQSPQHGNETDEDVPRKPTSWWFDWPTF